MRGRRASAEARTPLPQRIAAGAFVVPGACAGGVCREACAGWSCREVCRGRVPGTCAGGLCGRCVPRGLAEEGGGTGRASRRRGEGVGRSEDLFRSGLRLLDMLGRAGGITPAARRICHAAERCGRAAGLHGEMGCGCKERPSVSPVMPDLSDRSRRNTPAARRVVEACGR